LAGIKQVVSEVKQAVQQTIEPAQKAVQQAQQIAKTSANSYNQAKQSINSYKQAINSTTAQQTILERKINDLKNILNTPTSSKYFNENEVLEMKAELEKLERQLSKLQGKGKSLDVSPHVNNTAKAINNAVSSLKRFALSLFSIRGIFSMVSRAAGAYLAMDSDQTDKIQSNWAGLGSFLAPIIEYITSLMARGLAYINAFLKALTGIDYVARANAKALNSQAKSTKAAAAAAKQLASIDEISNLSDSNGGGGADISSIPQIELPNIDTTKVTEFANKVKEIWDWLTKNRDLIIEIGAAITLAFAVYKIDNFITAVKKINPNLLGAAIGIAGIAAGVIAVTKLLDENSDLVKAFGYILLSIGLIMIAVFLLFGAIPALIVGLILAIGFLITTLILKWEEFVAGVKFLLTNLGDFIVSAWTKLGDIIVAILSKVGDFFVSVWNGIITFFGGVWNWIVDKAKSIGETFSNVWINVKNGFLSTWDTIKNTVGTIGTTISNAIGGTIKSVVNGVIGFAETTVNGFIRAINLAIGVLNAIPGVSITKLNLLNIPRMAEGGVATGSTYANIGEGKYQEAVIPLGQSPQFRNMKQEIAEAASDKQNSGLEQLVVQIGEKRFIYNIIDLINEQSRVMGKAVIKV